MSVRDTCTRPDGQSAGEQARRGIPLWFAGTCLVGALCQPDVQATMHPDVRGPEAGSLVATVSLAASAAGATLHDADTVAVAATGPAKSLEPTAVPPPGTSRAAGWGRATPLRLGERPRPALPSAEQAVVPPSLPADGRLSTALVAPAQDALSKHIADTWRVDERRVSRYIDRVWDVAEELALDPFLMLAIMAVESSFDADARSSQGAQGLMQVHTRVHRDKFAPYGGASRATDPAVNIRVGGQILKQYLDRYQSPPAALKAYVGAARLKSDGGYSAKVLKQHRRFRDVVVTEFARIAADGFVSRVDRRIYDSIVGERFVSAAAQQ